MKNKKGQGLSVNALIIVALAVGTLLVIGFFTYPSISKKFNLFKDSTTCPVDDANFYCASTCKTYDIMHSGRSCINSIQVCCESKTPGSSSSNSNSGNSGEATNDESSGNFLIINEGQMEQGGTYFVTAGETFNIKGAGTIKYCTGYFDTTSNSDEIIYSSGDSCDIDIIAKEAKLDVDYFLQVKGYDKKGGNLVSSVKIPLKSVGPQTSNDENIAP